MLTPNAINTHPYKLLHARPFIQCTSVAMNTVKQQYPNKLCRVQELNTVCTETCAADRSEFMQHFSRIRSDNIQKTFANTTVGLGTLKIAAGHQEST